MRIMRYNNRVIDLIRDYHKCLYLLTTVVGMQRDEIVRLAVLYAGMVLGVLVRRVAFPRHGVGTTLRTLASEYQLVPMCGNAGMLSL
jgi:hypothetical protein